MALYIHNITRYSKFDGPIHDYAVKVNDTTLVEFTHPRDDGAAACFRAAADALDAANYSFKHDEPVVTHPGTKPK